MGFPMSYPLLTKLAFSSPKSRRPSAQDHGVCRASGVGKRGEKYPCACTDYFING